MTLVNCNDSECINNSDGICSSDEIDLVMDCDYFTCTYWEYKR